MTATESKFKRGDITTLSKLSVGDRYYLQSDITRATREVTSIYTNNEGVRVYRYKEFNNEHRAMKSNVNVIFLRNVNDVEQIAIPKIDVTKIEV